ncbi:MAG TPA: hypothetical protein ENK31_07240 [Nannocystis exedens]|nr:hypothetical protein [Nannocystis exedens]
MIGFLRTGISLLFLSLLVWCSFTVPLGSRTLAEHVDRIGETRAAKELIRGARGRINPALEGAKGRLLGEYVEAPTYSSAEQKPKEKTKNAKKTKKPLARSSERSASREGRSRADGQEKATVVPPDSMAQERRGRSPSTPAAPRLPGT